MRKRIRRREGQKRYRKPHIWLPTPRVPAWVRNSRRRQGLDEWPLHSQPLFNLWSFRDLSLRWDFWSLGQSGAGSELPLCDWFIGWSIDRCPSLGGLGAGHCLTRNKASSPQPHTHRHWLQTLNLSCLWHAFSTLEQYSLDVHPDENRCTVAVSLLIPQALQLAISK